MRRIGAKPSPKTKTVVLPSSAPFQFPAWLMAALLALATLVLYWPALQHGFVNYDDDRYVTANPRVQSGLTLDNIRWAFVTPVADNWHPLTVLSHLLVCQFCHLNPWSHHFASVLLHAANAALVFVLLRQLTGTFWKSAIVAALFAVHPLRVESVAWIAERKDVLSGLFGLLALTAYTRYAQVQILKQTVSKFLTAGTYWLALLWFTLGLLSKPMLVTWPFVLLLLDYWPLGRFKRGCIPQLIVEKIPFLLLAAAASVVTFLVQNGAGVVETIQHLPLSVRCETAAIAFCRYLGKTIWPADLAVFYPHPGHWPPLEVCLSVSILVAASLALLTQWRQRPFLLMGWLWFLGTLVPVIGLVQVGLQSMADRYTYLPCLGILIVAVWGAEDLTQSWRPAAAVLGTAAAAAIAACSVATRIQLQYWQDGETLFRHTIAVTENNYIARYNLGVALDEKKHYPEAIEMYRSVIDLHPPFARAHVNLGLDLDKTGQTEAAAASYATAIRFSPDNAEAHNNLGVALFKQGKNVDAIREFQDAVRLEPNNAGAHNSLAAALYNQGMHDEGMREFQAAIELDPGLAEAHYNYASILARRGQTKNAVLHFQEALRLKPDYPEARNALAKILGAQESK